MSDTGSQVATLAVPTLHEKEDAYAAALITALHDTALQLGGPDMHAAVVALAHSTGYLLSNLDAKDRLALRAAFIERMDADAAAFANARFLAKADPAGRA